MKRLDQAMVERGLCEGRERAKRLIMAGEVQVNARPARKASDPVRSGDAITLRARDRYVSRGGLKLEHALAHFEISVSGETVIDLGASTGGFTDCLLQAGAAHVFSVDVGKGQLAWRLRSDARVTVMESLNARFLSPEHFPAGSIPVGLATIDCSFISLRMILPVVFPLVRVGGSILALIKPQFEVGKEEADRGRGVIQDGALHEAVLGSLRAYVETTPEVSWQGATESPIVGPKGNKEFLAWIKRVEQTH